MLPAAITVARKQGNCNQQLTHHLTVVEHYVPSITTDYTEFVCPPGPTGTVVSVDMFVLLLWLDHHHLLPSRWDQDPGVTGFF